MTSVERAEPDVADTAVAVPVTRELAEFAAGLRYEDLPTPVVAHLEECLLDTAGCGLFGSTLPWNSILRRTLAQVSDKGSSGIWGTGMSLGPTDAALANGTAAHSFELDDLHKESILHPGSVVVSAALSAADVRGSCSGRRFVTALAAGYEVGIRVGMSVGTAHLLQGWHPTGTHGTIAAAAAASVVLGLTAEQTNHALGIAGSQSAGLMASQFSSMVKRFHAGRAAQSGLYSALLAHNGFTGIVDLLEAEYGGYCRTFSPTSDLAVVLDGLGTRWETARVGFKPYSTNGSCHTSIDLLRDLRRTEGFDASVVERVDIAVSSATAAHVGWPYRPDTVTTAQMNLPYITAVVITDGEAFVDQFSPERISDPQLVELADRVRVTADPQIDAGGPAHRHESRIRIHLRDGRVLTGQRRSARGSADFPLTRDEVHEKFRTLAATALPADRVIELEALLGRVPELDSTKDLSAALAA